MRRTLATLTATAVLLPVAVTAAPGAASAATNTLTVTAIDRNGAAVATRVSVVNLSTRATYTLTSGKARTLPRGTYVALASIHTPTDDSVTVGGRTAKVTGASTTVIDARKGRPLNVTLNPAPHRMSHADTTVRICASVRPSTYVSAAHDPERVYVVPNSSRNFQFAHLSYWSEPKNGATNDVGYVVTGTTQGVPAGYSRTVERSSLAPVTLTARSGTAFSSEHNYFMDSTASGCLRDMGATAMSLDESHRLQYNWKTPHRFTAHVSPGTWNFKVIGDDSYQDRTLTLQGGKNYGLTFFRAAYGPNTFLPTVSGFGRLSFTTMAMLDNPDSTSAEGSYETNSRTVVTLSRGGKILKKQTRDNFAKRDPEFSHTLPAAGWYGLTADARRYHPEKTVPAGILSPRVVAKYRFYADPRKNQAPPAHLIRIAAGGLDIQNRAEAESTTNLVIKVQRPKQAEPRAKSTVRTVTAQVLYDNGKTWKKTTLKKSGSKWVATVKNPGSGYVTVRAKAVDTKGNSSEVTIYRAYRIR